MSFGSNLGQHTFDLIFQFFFYYSNNNVTVSLKLFKTSIYYIKPDNIKLKYVKIGVFFFFFNFFGVAAQYLKLNISNLFQLLLRYKLNYCNNFCQKNKLL